VPPGARIQTEAVAYEHLVADGPDGQEKRPRSKRYLSHDGALTDRRLGVLIVHDWTGVGPNVRMCAQMLARLAYVALAAEACGAGIHPTGMA
jgi:dienelactone hydrolase